MRLHETVAAYMSRACAEVFFTMMGVTLPAVEISLDQATPDANDGVLSLIGLAGRSWTGTGSVACSPDLACHICSQLLMTEVCAVSEDVLDAVAELTNMIIGSVKNDLEPSLGPLGLSIPTVVYGKNFKTRSTGTVEWTTLRYEWDGQPLLVRLSLVDREQTQPRLHLVSQSCAAEV